MGSNTSLGRLLSAATLIGGIASVHGPHQAVTAQSAIQVIASGLDNPRGLTFGPDGALYVVEAGRGGSSALCLPLPNQPGLRCYGPSGAVTRISALGVQQRVVTGLPSLAVANGETATGPHDIDFGFGRAWITIGLAADPAVRTPFTAAGIRLGTLVRVLPTGAWDYTVDISAHETATNPDGTTVDSNPYGLRVVSDRVVVTDAGANALLQISLDGSIGTLAVFPARAVAGRSMQSVPTTVTSGPNGELFVGELTGVPYPVGAASVFRVPGNGGTPLAVAGGFTNIIDIVYDERNRIGYVLEHDADGIIPATGPGVTGRLIRVTADGSQTVIASAGLVKPGGIALGPDGALYVTNRSISPGIGEVVRIHP